jgi:hypothetical protein
MCLILKYDIVSANTHEKPPTATAREFDKNLLENELGTNLFFMKNVSATTVADAVIMTTTMIAVKPSDKEE